MSLLGKFWGTIKVWQKTCDFCGTKIIPHGSSQADIDPSIRMTKEDHVRRMRSAGIDPRKRVKHTGHRCSACNIITCCPCSQRAAAKLGVRYFVCPECGANIHQNMV